MRKDDAFDPEHLKIAFHRLQPEVLLSSICSWYDFNPRSSFGRVHSDDLGNYAYHHYATAYSGNSRTDDEASYLNRHFKQRIATDNGQCSVFELLRNYSKSLLVTDGTQPLCRYERLLRWRQVSLTLSQDLFTTAYAASEDLCKGHMRKNFVWPAIIGTDNQRLSQITAQGISENHFHLTGSTRVFPLSWACMMNHPEQIHVFFSSEVIRENFRDRLNQVLAIGAEARPLPWPELLLYAAYLRANLFRRAVQDPDPAVPSDKWVNEFLEFVEDPASRLQQTRSIVEILRYDSGAARLLQPDRRSLVLDYALTSDLIGCYESHNRLLAGERHLLYRLFYLSFSGELTSQEQDCFYLYLLIQNQFRSELIQVNGRVGFQNFARYQERKDLFWEDIPGYKAESIRLGVNAILEGGHIRALEARVNPARPTSSPYRKIRELDELYGFAETGVLPREPQLDIIADSPLFYVVHFPKNTFEIPDGFHNSSKDLCSLLYPRNSGVRRRSEIQAKLLAKALASSPYLRKRVRAIDACANEIGCRPETFATEFRFLRSGIPCVNGNYFMPESESKVSLRATYHAGEDFIDIIDGLRAIDEAQLFLELHRGDRLGHALAMGVDPASYYNLKKMRLIIPKQDLLDNLVWILYRPLEYNLDPPRRLQKRLELKAIELMNEIGYDATKFELLDYYTAWRLRGDHPSVYLPGWTEDDFHIQDGSYEDFLTMAKPSLKVLRKTDAVRQLLNLYHFDTNIKKKGRQVESYLIDPEMVHLVEQLQSRMQHQLMEKGLAIECNPSSNVLIGSFEKYRDHPIFRFNRHGLRIPRWEKEAPANLSVSLNTDDQGVFDTSLECEYAFVASCLEREVDSSGNRINSNDEIYDYLNHLRILGNSQTFHHMHENAFSSSAQDYAAFCDYLNQSSVSYED